MLPTLLWGQNVSFEAICNAQEVLEGNPFEVTFQLNNATIKKFDPPAFNGLQAQGPNVGQSISYINGSSSSSQTYTYYVVANKPGTYKINPATVITGAGKALRTKPITVKVLKASSQPQNDNNAALAGKVFLRTELSNTDAVVGEQITVDIRIYTQIGIEQTELIKEPTFENVFSHYLSSFNDQAKIVVIEGEQYITQILRRIVVFPSKAGTIVVEPAIVDIGVASNKGRSLFNPFYLEKHTLKTLPVELNVKDLGGAATGFTGAVGAYTMQAHVENNNLTADDVVEITLQIRGKGDIKQVAPPSLGTNAKYFDQFDPNINEDIREGGGFLGGFKEFQYVLTPKATGSFTVTPTFTFFDPQKKRFVTIDTTINITIAKGNNSLPTKEEVDANKTVKETVKDAEQENLLSFNAPVTAAQLVPRQQSPFLGSILFWFLAILPFIGLLGFTKWHEQQTAKANIPVAEHKRNNAQSQAAIRLQQAKAYLDQKDATSFYKEIANALLGFVSDKYNIPNVELTKDNVRQQLAQKQLSAEKIDSLVNILQTAEMAVFAGMADNASMEKIYQESTALIQVMEDVV